MTTFEEANDAYDAYKAKQVRDIKKERGHENGTLREELARASKLLQDSGNYMILIVSHCQSHEIMHNPCIDTPDKFSNIANIMLHKLDNAPHSDCVSKGQEAVK